MKSIKVIMFLMIFIEAEQHHDNSNNHSYYRELFKSKSDFFNKTDGEMNKLYMNISEYFANKPKNNVSMHDELNSLLANLNNSQLYKVLGNNIALNIDNKTINATGLDILVNNKELHVVNKEENKTSLKSIDRKEFREHKKSFSSNRENLTNGVLLKNNDSSKFFDSSIKVWKPPASSNSVETRRIYGGKRTDIQKYPFIVSVHVRGQFTCAGSIISEDLVITAASCLQIYYNSNFYRKKPKFTHIRHGSDWTSRGGTTIPVLEIFFHPRFDLQTLHHNLAIIRLKRSLKMEKHKTEVNKIQLHKSGVLPTDDKRVTILGWGAKQLNQFKNNFGTLSAAHLEVYSIEECKKIYTAKYVIKHHFCAGVKTNGKGACNRDIGGPGIMDGLLVGVISFGAPVCGTKGSPTVFTKVGHYTAWIKSIMEKKGEPEHEQVKNSSNTDVHRSYGQSSKRPKSKMDSFQNVKSTTRHQIKTKKPQKLSGLRTKYPYENEVKILNEILRQLVGNDTLLNNILYDDFDEYFGDILKSEENKDTTRHPFRDIYVPKSTTKKSTVQLTFEFSTYPTEVNVDLSAQNPSESESDKNTEAPIDNLNMETTEPITNETKAGSIRETSTIKDLTLRLNGTGLVTAIVRMDDGNTSDESISDNYESDPGNSNQDDVGTSLDILRSSNENAKKNELVMSTRNFKYGVTEMVYDDARIGAISDDYTRELLFDDY